MKAVDRNPATPEARLAVNPRVSFLLFITLSCLLNRQVLADYPIEVIELQARPLEELLPVIRPFAGADGTVTGMGNSLVVKAAPARIREIRRLLAELDRPPHRLLITVGSQGGRAARSSGYSASADIRAGDAQVGINSPGYPVEETRARLSLHDRNTQDARDASYRVQALEGRPAYIRSGVRVPLHGTQHYYGSGIPYVRDTTQWQAVASGFYVVPRLNGAAVTLEILQHDDRPGRGYGTVRTQGAATVVRGRLGEWLDLGGIDASSRQHQGGPGQARNSRVNSTHQIQVRVECIDCQ
jgi:hypothetical protein